MGAYYHKAFPRAFHAAIEWAIGQGWVLILSLAVAGLVCAALFAFVRAARRHDSWSIALGDIRSAVTDFLLVFAGATIVVICALFVIFLVRDAPDQVSIARAEANRLKQQIAALQAQINIRDSKGLLVECHPGLPLIMPRTGFIYVLYIDNYPLEAPINSIAKQSGVPGATIAWPESGNMLTSARVCKIINYSDTILTNITMTPQIGFMKTASSEPQSQDQGVYLSSYGDVSVDKIDVGRDNAFVFCIINITPEFVLLSTPATAIARPLGAQEDRLVPVSSNGGERTPLSPLGQPSAPL
jgi:hypothetical protein